MQIFLDSASVKDIRQALTTGFVDGITTNPTLLSRQTSAPLMLFNEICVLTPGPVSIEVMGETSDEMIEHAKQFVEISNNVVIKVPLTMEGLKACMELRKKNIGVNVTLCFSTVQALLAAKAGATYVSPFIGRLDDAGISGEGLLREIRDLYNMYNFPTKIIAASIRHPKHVLEACKAGAHIATIPPSVFYKLYDHPLTEQGIRIFNRDWKTFSSNRI